MAATNKFSIKDERLLRLRDFLMFAYCQAVRHNGIVVSQRKEEFVLRVSEVKHFNDMFPVVNECEHVAPIPTMIQLLELCSNEEKKLGKEQSLETYRMLLQLFPLFKRFNMRAELSMPAVNEPSIRLREVRRALLDSSFSDAATNFLSTNIKISPANE